jgi:predicted MPP superfamily phosphohydrolase
VTQFQTLFWFLLPFALLGDARIFLFIINRLVFGSHRHEENPLRFLLWALPPVLLLLTILWLPLARWLRFLDRITPERFEEMLSAAPLEKIGAAWLVMAAAVGMYWIVDRIRANWLAGRQPAGTRTLESTVIPLRRPHIPFAWLRKLGAHNEVYDIEVTRHEVVVDDLPPQFDGFKIAFLTDTHVAAIMRRRFYREVVKQVGIVEPDVILLGGDFCSFKRHIPLLIPALLEGLSAKHGIYAVLGNHDYWTDPDAVRATLASHGVEFVINRSIALHRDGAELTILGIDEVYRGEPDLDAAFANVKRPAIGISHHPDIIDELGGRDLDLLVCGHTHGGQIRFPFFGPIVVPSRHEGRYASGFVRRGGVLMYVSRGIGALPPLRILCKPEVATFVLRPS